MKNIITIIILCITIQLNSQITYDTISKPNKSLLINRNITLDWVLFANTASFYKNRTVLTNYIGGISVNVNNHLELTYLPIGFGGMFTSDGYHDITEKSTVELFPFSFSTGMVRYAFNRNKKINFELLGMTAYSIMNKKELLIQGSDELFNTGTDDYFRNTIGVQTNFNLFMKGTLSILVGYEFSSGLNLPNVNSKDFSGLMIGLIFKGEKFFKN